MSVNNRVRNNQVPLYAFKAKFHLHFQDVPTAKHYFSIGPRVWVILIKFEFIYLKNDAV